jgi:hypothetical protein
MHHSDWCCIAVSHQTIGIAFFSIKLDTTCIKTLILHIIRSIPRIMPISPFNLINDNLELATMSQKVLHEGIDMTKIRLRINKKRLKSAFYPFFPL